ncbi:MAG: hypothetical protein WAM27_07335, partial [Nitrososphaeraceae archaeon]
DLYRYCLGFYERSAGIETTDQYENIRHCKMLLERGYIAINPAFDELIISLRTAVAEENILDKECTLYADF